MPCGCWRTRASCPVEDLDRPAPAAPRLEGGVDPTGFGTPLTAGYAADPVNTALGNFVEVETDLSFAGLPAGLTFARTYNSCSDRDGPFGARLVELGDGGAAGRVLDGRVRGSGRAAGQLPAHRPGRVRARGRDRRPGGAGRPRAGCGVGAGVVRRAPLGVRPVRPDPADLGRPRHRRGVPA